jgi:hypothetical protein
MESYLRQVALQFGRQEWRTPGVRSGDVEWMLSATAQLKFLNTCFLRLPRDAIKSIWVAELDRWLPSPVIDAVAGGSYSLFSLGWETPVRWLATLERSAHSGGASQPVSCSAQRDFVLSALFFAWHLVRSSRLACSYTLGMHDDVQAAFSKFPLAELPQLASISCQWLEPRWPRQPRFWPELLRHAQQEDLAGVRDTLLFGRQLLSGEQLDGQ